MMNTVSNKTITSRKVGAEDIIMVRLPIDRFHDNIPPHYAPPIYKTTHYQVALLAQACRSNSFAHNEAGQTDDLHLWLNVGSSDPGATVKGADIMLPSAHWLSLASATGNTIACKYLQSFGLSPLNLDKIKLQKQSGIITFSDGGQIEWTINGPGKELPHVGVNHVIYVKTDTPNAIGHRVAALVSDTVMEQSGSVHIQTANLEPFLLKGESFTVVVHRMSKLEANIAWQQHLN